MNIHRQMLRSSLADLYEKKKWAYGDLAQLKDKRRRLGEEMRSAQTNSERQASWERREEVDRSIRQVLEHIAFLKTEIDSIKFQLRSTGGPFPIRMPRH